ncbi:corticotropin receptor [Mactra antiquata]
MNKSYISEITGKPYCRFFGVLTNEYFVISLVGNLIVLVSTVALYVGIIIQAFKHVRNMKILTNGSPNNHSTFNDPTWNLVKTFTIIVVFTNVCWSPTVVLMMMHANGHLDHLSIKVQGRLVAYTSIGMFLNALVNPLIYAAKIGEVRTRFRKLFCCETKSSSRRKKALTTLSTVSTNDFNDLSP